MPRSCTVCAHPDANDINEFLVLKRLSNRKTAALCDVSEASIRRHREHIPKLLVLATRAEKVAEADRMLERILEHLERGHALEGKAADAGELGYEIRAHGEVRGDLKLLAGMLGAISTAPTVNILMNNPTWVALEGLVVDALAPYPDARAAVLGALEGAEKGAIGD